MTVAVLALLPGSAPPASAQTPAAERLRIPFPAYDGTLTPYTFALGYPLVTLIYDTLMWRDANGIPQPWLAQSVTRSNGGRRLTVRLRDGVRWHDGRAVTAADVAFTFRYVADRYQPRFTPQLERVRRVRATGRLTAVIELDRPSLGFEDQPLADLPILPRHRWQDLPAGRSAPAGMAIGSGPYRLVRAGRERGYVFRANSRYFRGAPAVREIRVPFMGDVERSYEALRRREADMLPLSLPASVADDLGDTPGINVERGASYAGTMLVLNVRRPPFDDRAARRAVAAALDIDRIARRAAPAVAADEGFIHPASRWATHDRIRRPDPQAPRAGRAIGTPVRVLAPANDPVRLEAGREVVLALNQAGARATLVQRSREQLERAAGLGGGQPTFEAAIATIPPLASYDPSGLTRLFSSDPRIGALNTSGYRSEEFDDVAAGLATAADEEARRSAVRELLDLLARDAPAIPLFFPRGAFAYRTAAYSNWTFVEGSGILDKRSFLASDDGAAGEAQTDVEQDPALAADGGDDSGAIGIANIISLVVVLAVIVLAVLGLRQRRRERL
ncbi:MAG: ABC transporter substrate-binding protein [Thermoleophilia bacterium]